MVQRGVFHYVLVVCGIHARVQCIMAEFMRPLIEETRSMLGVGSDPTVHSRTMKRLRPQSCAGDVLFTPNHALLARRLTGRRRHGRRRGCSARTAKGLAAQRHTRPSGYWTLPCWAHLVITCPYCRSSGQAAHPLCIVCRCITRLLSWAPIFPGWVIHMILQLLCIGSRTTCCTTTSTRVCSTSCPSSRHQRKHVDSCLTPHLLSSSVGILQHCAEFRYTSVCPLF